MTVKKTIGFILLFFWQAYEGHCRQYYVDALKGDDMNNGVAINTPWKTLAKVNTTVFRPGDVVSFKAGQRFIGTLLITSSGKAGLSIRYTTYGNGPAAVIDGNGDSAAIYAYNKEYIEFSNLAVTNFRSGEIRINSLFNGIYIVNEDAGTLHHIYFDKVRVFDVNSTYLAKDEGKTDQSRFHGGVQFRTVGNRVRSWFDDVLITSSVFENLSRTGFNFRSDWDDRAAYSRFGDSIGNGLTDNWTPNTRVVFRKNIFRNIAGNGLIVRVANKAIIEYNLFDSCGKFISGNAVFNFSTDSTVYQYNEARNTIYNPGDTDARGIDSDYRTKHTIIQYNYLHDNGLGGVTATGGPGVGDNPVNFNIGTVIRYNIIENNARQGAYFSGRVEGLQVYNNVFYADERFDSVTVLKLNRWTVYPSGAEFRNNIFQYKGKAAHYDFTASTNNRFNYNVYDGVPPPEKFRDDKRITGDPLFVNPGKGKSGYRLKTGSPAVGAALFKEGDTQVDFYGRHFLETILINAGIDQTPKAKR